MFWTECADQSRIIIGVDTNILNGKVGVRITAGEVLSRSADEHVDALGDGLQLDVARSSLRVRQSRWEV